MPASLAKHLADPPLGIVIEQQHVSLTRHSFAELIAQSSHLARSWPVMAWLIVCHIDAARGRSLLGSPYTLVETLRRIMWEWPVGNTDGHYATQQLQLKTEPAGELVEVDASDANAIANHRLLAMSFDVASTHC